MACAAAAMPEPSSYAAALQNHPPPMASSPPTSGTHKGEIAAFFSPELQVSLAAPYKHALVGKFSRGRPRMDIIHDFLKAQDFKGSFTVGLLDPKHVLINFQGDSDFLRLYSRKLCYISKCPMRVFKWSIDFHVLKESSVVPVWFNLPLLPVQFFGKDALFFIASQFGNPLRMDAATMSLKRPSVARIQVEIDLMKTLPKRIWIGNGDGKGFWQVIEPDETIPSYCDYCWHVGHSDVTCTVKHPELKVIQPKPKQEFRPKTKRVEPDNAAPKDPHAASSAPVAPEDVPVVVRPSDLDQPSQIHQPGSEQPQVGIQQFLHEKQQPIVIDDPKDTSAFHQSDIDTLNVNRRHGEFMDSESLSDYLNDARDVLPTHLVHSDVEDGVRPVPTLDSLKAFSASLPQFPVPDSLPTFEWEQPKRRKKYTKRSFGQPNVRTRSVTYLSSFK